MYLYSLQFKGIWVYLQLIIELHVVCVVSLFFQKGNVFRASFRVNAHNRIEVGSELSFFFLFSFRQ